MPRIRLFTALILAVLAACSGSNGPDVSPAGAWHATKLVVTENGTRTDGVAAGVTIAMVLTSNGSTSGTLHIPAALNDSGVDGNESLAGTWSFDADSTHISFDHATDSFIRDNPWAYNGSMMNYSAAGSGAGDKIEATLARD